LRSGADPQADATLAFSKKLILWPLDSDLAIKAAEVSARYSLAMADAIIYATARDARADLPTCDAHCANLPNVVDLTKTAPP
jgi:predicted nucleic acid-binding protein